MLIAFCLLVISLSGFWTRRIELETSYLSAEAQQVLKEYAEEGRQAALEGPAAVDAFLLALQAREPGWSTLLDKNLQTLSSQALDAKGRENLIRMRHLDGPMSRRGVGLPIIGVPFADGSGRLAIRLPERYRPWRYTAMLVALVQFVIPALLALLFCVGLYRVLISPLARLCKQADAVRAGQFAARLAPEVIRRKDEMGELGRALQHMTERMQESVFLQRQMLRDLSHELRTPLSRLQVACESNLSHADYQGRVRREIKVMRDLVDSTLELAWMDAERPSPALESVSVEALWELLREDACFETGWSAERFPCDLPANCHVLGHLNSLARAMENILRNAIRYSPENGVIHLVGRRANQHWLLWIEDRGPGVAEHELDLIFRPFTRLNEARPGDDGFGLGLAIAQRMIRLQEGEMWAENAHPGLRLVLRLQSLEQA
ncbi:two-component system sensor histidine kinase PfeS [Azomonas macrocytogenes]|uniref:histidine kinase n=1 Tax=Azomonas macrocytogenes TaxID=69962 RepID=A0A839SWD4_AZOMA|nr:histidine kinase sensor domain-containing protein [Azomonas macrocytogenes]MBB3101701.1 two-component system sensor histidine kinase PfeS [Azomonas macrocytogenes]